MWLGERRKGGKEERRKGGKEEMTKTYNETNFGDDLKECFVHAGTVGPVTFLFTDAQIKKENFLEFIIF